MMRTLWRHFASACIVVAMVTVAWTDTPSDAMGGFGDVPSGVFYSDAVQWLVDESLTTGTSPGCFSPDRPMTRGELATFVHRYAGLPPGAPHPFNDVPPTAFYAAAVAWMYSAGVTTGTSSTTFAPDREVTRGEVAAFLWRYDGFPPAPPSTFIDVPASAFFAEAVDWMASTGITTGTSPTTFSPLRTLTRAEFGTFLYRYAGSPPVQDSGGGLCPETGESTGSPPDLGDLDAVFVETFSSPAIGTGNRNGDLDATRFSVARWRSEMSTDGTQHVTDGPVPPTDVRIENDAAVIDVGSQNFGDTVVRINQPFDISDRTGTVGFDTVLHRPAEGLSGLWGWPTFMFLADPYSAPSYFGDNSDGPTPRSGLVLHFPWNCGAPLVRTYVDGVQTDDRSAWHHEMCAGLPTTAPDTMNRVRLGVSNFGLEVCVSDAGPAPGYAHCWSFPVQLDFTRGWLHFGGHNHATQKYGGGPVWTTKWDNVIFDGPSVPMASVSQVDNGPGRDIGYSLPEQGTTPVNLTLPDVDLAGATRARLTLSARADEISNGNHASWRLNYQLNDGPVHSVPFPLGPDGAARTGTLFTFDVPLVELRDGANTVAFTGANVYSGYQPYIGNIDLIVQ